MGKRNRSESLRWLDEGTERRRERRWHRKRTYLVATAILIVGFIVALPSFFTLSPFANRMVASLGESHGWTLTAKQIRIGWITPLRLTGIEAVGPSGDTVIVADSVDARVTLLDLLQAKSNWGTINVDGPRMEAKFHDNGSTLEDDLALLLAPTDEPGNFSGNIVLRDAVIKLSEAASGKAWRADQLQASVSVDSQQTTLQTEGVITDPDSISGAFNLNLILPAAAADTEITVRGEGLPLSLVDIVRTRFPQSADSLPRSWSGNATGQVYAALHVDGTFLVRAEPLNLRNLIVIDDKIAGDKPWKIGHANLKGGLSMKGDSLLFDQFDFVTDSGTMAMNGSVDLNAIQSGKYLDAMYGEFNSEFDLASLTQAVPGLLPIRGDVVVRSGRVKAAITGDYDSNQQFRSSWKLDTEPIHATMTNGQKVVLEPITADIVLRPSKHWISAERLLIRSNFGEATATGDLRTGQAKFDLDFERLDASLQSILDLPPQSLGGLARGDVRWSVADNNVWTINGSASAKDLMLTLPGTKPIRRPSVDLKLSGQGLWGDGQLQRLDIAEVTLAEADQAWTAKLTAPVNSPDQKTLYPLQINGRGRLETLSEWIGNWTPQSVGEMQGLVTADISCELAADRGELTVAKVSLDGVSAFIGGERYQQDSVKTEFVGSYRWPANALRAEKLTLSGNVASMAIQGEWSDRYSNLDVAYRTDLQRLQNMVAGPNPTTSSTTSQLTGIVEGQIRISSENESVTRIDATATSNDVRIVQQVDRAQPQTVWQESDVRLGSAMQWDADKDTLLVQQFKVHVPWLIGDVGGDLVFRESGHELQMTGPVEMDMNIISQRLTTYLGEPIKMTGRHKSELRVTSITDPDGQENLLAKTSLGWTTAQVSGITAGAAEIPLRITKQSVYIDPAAIPIQQGQVNLAGEVHYMDEPLWFEQRPGMFAEGLTFTPDMCRSWLKYMMPIAADATEVTGTFSVELAKCKVVPSDPIQSNVAGVLRVEGASVGPGPLTQNLIVTINQLEAAAKGLAGQAAAPVGARQWIQLDPQAVDFSLDSGQVSHQRMQMRIGKASLISSGSVSLDGRLGLRFQLPLESTWLGSDLAGLAGRQITLPVGGTLSRPVLDSQAVAGTIGQLGTQAVQSTAENFLQKQLDRNLQKLFGK